MKEGEEGGGGDGHPSPRCPCAASETRPASQLQGERAQRHGGQAGTGSGGTVTVLFVRFTPGLLAQDALEAHGADAALVLVAGAAVLAQQELVVAHIGCGVTARGAARC